MNSSWLIPGSGSARRFRSGCFEQESASTSHQYGGTGLGLAITNNFVKMMGGKITVKSEPGMGSWFIVSLTLECPEQDRLNLAERIAHMQVKRTEPKSYDNIKGIHILLAKDNAINSETLRTIMESHGATVDPVFDGQEALNELHCCAERWYFGRLHAMRKMSKRTGEFH